MRLHTQPPVILTPVGPIETATEVRVTRGQDWTEIPIQAILPAFNKQDLPEEVMRRELIVRAWLSGTTGPDGGRPIVAQNPLFRTNVNTGVPGAGIFSGRGRVFMGTPIQTTDGYIFPWGPSDTNTPHEALVSSVELELPNPESPLFSAIPLIAANLMSRDPNAPCAPGVEGSRCDKVVSQNFRASRRIRLSVPFFLRQL